MTVFAETEWIHLMRVRVTGARIPIHIYNYVYGTREIALFSQHPGINNIIMFYYKVEDMSTRQNRNLARCVASND